MCDNGVCQMGGECSQGESCQFPNSSNNMCDGQCPPIIGYDSDQRSPQDCCFVESISPCGLGESAGMPENNLAMPCNQQMYQQENDQLMQQQQQIPCNYEQPVEQCIPEQQQQCNQKLRYIQPPPAQSYRPCPNFKRPEIHMECDTIYKKSYLDIDAQVAANCRPNPVKPYNHIHSSCAKMDTKTVTALSFPGHCNVPAAKAIRPCAPSLLGQGPMQDLTTQKHDFVPKPFSKRPIIMPQDNMPRTCSGLENQTTTRMSYMPPNMDRFCRAESYKPQTCYQSPEIPMDVNTTQKMSYQPVCPQQKETFPWATRACFQQPTLPMENDTTYKMSYIKNCGDTRAQPCYPMVNSKIITANTCFDDHTVYNESYLQSCGEKAKPVYPQPQLHIPCNEKMNTNTIYQMAYQGHCNVARRQPIRPCPPSLLGQGPMQDLTTQKHDFVPKPFSKRCPIMPNNLMPKTNAGLENQTTSRLSYMAPNMDRFARAVSYRPIQCYQPPEVPMDVNTTQKMSFLPVCPQQKEIYPWAQRAKFREPGIPMDTQTTQKLSFMPPGQFIEDSGCCMDYPSAQYARNDACFPKAAIVR